MWKLETSMDQQFPLPKVQELLSETSTEARVQHHAHMLDLKTSHGS